MDFHGTDFTCTSSVDHPKDGALTFARTFPLLWKAANSGKRLGICCPLGFGGGPPNVELFPLEFFEYEFTKFHNSLNHCVKEDIIGKNFDCDLSVVFGEGIHVAVGPGGLKEHLRHIGNVVIGDNVFVGAFTLLQRGTFDSTIIHDGVKIDSNTIIGHNSEIGENSVLSHAILGGSVKIGKNCWLGMGCIIKNGISICDNVVVGQGANVVKNITEPGIYAGNPARYMKPVPERYNF